MISRSTNVRVKHFKVFSFTPEPSGNNPETRNIGGDPRPRPMSEFERSRLRAKVAAVTCSEPWAESVSASAERLGVDPNSVNVARALADRGIYPPRADLGPDRRPRRGAVRMRRCDACGRIVPPIALAEHRMVRICDDCRIQPPADLDETEIARAPGAQQIAVMEGLDAVDLTPPTARQQLLGLGLSESEVMALAFTHAGYSTRQVAEFGRWSQTYVRKLITSAGNKLKRSGLKLPEKHEPVSMGRKRIIDPIKLDGMSNHVRDIR